MAYFSQTGNTETIAGQIAEHTGGELFHVETVTVYPDEYNDFAGKTVIPFCTHEGSALGRSERDIAELVPEAELLEGLAIRGSNVDRAEDDVVSWLEGLGFYNPADGE